MLNEFALNQDSFQELKELLILRELINSGFTKYFLVPFLFNNVS